MGTLLGTRRSRGWRMGGTAAGETGARIGGTMAARSGAHSAIRTDGAGAGAGSWAAPPPGPAAEAAAEAAAGGDGWILGPGGAGDAVGGLGGGGMVF